jgi:hypothetical protein
MRSRSRSLFVLVAAVALVAGSCGAGPDETAGTDPTETEVPAEGTPTAEVTEEPDPTPIDTSTPTPGATPTPLPTPTLPPTPVPSATPPPVPDCNAPLTGTPVRTSVRFVDIDDDNDDDVLTVYGVGSEASPEQWRIRVEAGSGEAYDTELIVDPGGIAPVSAVGGADIDGDGVDELFSVVGVGASATIVGVHAILGCSLVRLSIEGGPIAAPVGGSAGNLAGLTCAEEQTLILWQGAADSGAGDGTYDITGQEYTLTGSTLDKIDDWMFTAKNSEIDFVYGELTCHGLTIAG